MGEQHLRLRYWKDQEGGGHAADEAAPALVGEPQPLLALLD
ncbi:hypothetical protein [Streptomyces sp. NPDC059166]